MPGKARDVAGPLLPKPDMKKPRPGATDRGREELQLKGYPMSHPIPEDVQRLVARLRLAADEIESAARYGVPIPSTVSVSGHRFGGANMSATEEEFSAWAEYAEAQVEHRHHHGADWSSFKVDINGLPLSVAVRHEPVEVVA